MTRGSLGTENLAVEEGWGSTGPLNPQAFSELQRSPREVSIVDRTGSMLASPPSGERRLLEAER